ncbi:MAG: DUF2179 domain-containing protein [Gemmatimonadales bacterium]|nr:DUF2179 domain-containing protein [Gemmatimonadales bacterium]
MSLGTLRTLTVVQGRIAISVVIGFLEILIWVTAISQVVTRITESPILPLAYAAGFAGGNACGIVLERRLGIGLCVIRMIVSEGAEGIAQRIRTMGHVVTTFEGRGRDGPRTLMFTTCQRRRVPALAAAVAAIDPNVFYTVDRFSHTGYAMPLPHATGWRAVFKKK